MSVFLQDNIETGNDVMPSQEVDCFITDEKRTTKCIFQRGIRQGTFLKERNNRDPTPTYHKDELYAEESEEPQWTMVRSRTTDQLPQYHPFFMARGKKDRILKFCKENLGLCLGRS